MVKIDLGHLGTQWPPSELIDILKSPYIAKILLVWFYMIQIILGPPKLIHKHTPLCLSFVVSLITFMWSRSQAYRPARSCPSNHLEFSRAGPCLQGSGNFHRALSISFTFRARALSQPFYFKALARVTSPFLLVLWLAYPWPFKCLENCQYNTFFCSKG